MWCLVFGVSGFKFMVQGSGFRVSCFVFRVPCFAFSASCSGFRVSSFVFQAPGFEVRVPGSGFRFSCFGCRVLGIPVLDGQGLGSTCSRFSESRAPRSASPRTSPLPSQNSPHRMYFTHTCTQPVPGTHLQDVGSKSPCENLHFRGSRARVRLRGSGSWFRLSYFGFGGWGVRVLDGGGVGLGEVALGELDRDGTLAHLHSPTKYPACQLMQTPPESSSSSLLLSSLELSDTQSL